MRGETMKDKSKKSTYSTTFGIDPKKGGGVKLSCTIFHYPDMTEILKIVNGDGEVQTIIESLEVSEDLWKR